MSDEIKEPNEQENTSTAVTSFAVSDNPVKNTDLSEEEKAAKKAVLKKKVQRRSARGLLITSIVMMIIFIVIVLISASIMESLKNLNNTPANWLANIFIAILGVIFGTIGGTFLAAIFGFLTFLFALLSATTRRTWWGYLIFLAEFGVVIIFAIVQISALSV